MISFNKYKNYIICIHSPLLISTENIKKLRYTNIKHKILRNIICIHSLSILVQKTLKYTNITNIKKTILRNIICIHTFFKYSLDQISIYLLVYLTCKQHKRFII